MEKEYFNTTRIRGDELVQKRNKVIKQEEILCNMIRGWGSDFNASELLLKFPIKGTPITSIRRALTGLKQSGKIIATGDRRDSCNGGKELCYIISNEPSLFAVKTLNLKTWLKNKYPNIYNEYQTLIQHEL